MTRIELEAGKYVVEHDAGVGLHALRHGQPWRDLTGDNLVLAMAQEIENLRKDAQRYRWLMSQGDLTGDNPVLAMAQEIENLRKDAQRYRWLMSQEEWPEMVDHAVELLNADMIDYYIDEAMSEVAE